MDRSRNTPRRWRTAIAGGLVILTVAATLTPAARADTGLSPFYEQRPRWSRCDEPGLAAMDCATIQVPMNYRDPSGRRLTLAVSRHRATERAGWLGVLVVNPTGPGGHWQPSAFLDRPVAERYELVGMAPRGDPPSTQVQCLAPGLLDNSYATLPSRPTDAQFSRFVRQARGHEKSCDALDDGLRPHITTANIARDLDVLREVLAAPRLSYVAGSASSAVPAAYGTLFPERTGRVVLDSTLAPDLSWYRFMSLDWPRVKARAVREFADWAGQRDGTYHLGRGTAAVLATLDRTSRRLATHPLGKFTQRGFDNFTARGTYTRLRWGEHARALSQLAKGREPDVDTSDLDPPAVRERYEGAIHAYTCESDWPRDLGTYYQRMRQARAHYPYGYGVALSGPSNCTFRSYARPERPVRVTERGLRGALVVQADHDATTTYRYGVEMATHTHSRLLTVADSYEHTPYTAGTNACVVRTVDAYLLDGQRPRPGARCQGADPAPNVPPDPS